MKLYQSFSGIILLKNNSSVHGRGIFAGKDYRDEDHIFDAFFGITPQPINFMNHSCKPNCVLHKLHVFAGRDIKEGEELTIDYRQIRFQVHPMSFDCLCGNEGCAGHIEVAQYKAS